MMDVIANKWIEKARKKKVNETASAYDAYNDDSFSVEKTTKKDKRHTLACHSVFQKTLRGVRK